MCYTPSGINDKEHAMRELFELFAVFARIGAVNFGGGYAMLPLLQQDLEKNRHWVTTEELMDYFAIGQCTPGIIAINVSTFVGYKKKGILGAIAGTLGFVFFPIIVILAIAMFLRNFADLEAVKHAFAGIRVCVCVLIVQAVMRLWKKSVVDLKSFLLYLAIFLLALFSKQLPISIPTAMLVLLAGFFGIVLGKEGKEVAK